MQLHRFVDAFVHDRQGRVAIVQKPNVPLVIGVIATLSQRFLPFGMWLYGAELIGYGFLFTWSWLEISQGSSYFRRVLGCAVAAWLILSRIM